MLEQKDLEMIAEIVNKIVEPIRKDVESVKNDVEQVKMTLENETNRNIQIIAEGHSDLTRKVNLKF